MASQHGLAMHLQRSLVPKSCSQSRVQPRCAYGASNAVASIHAGTPGLLMQQILVTARPTGCALSH